MNTPRCEAKTPANTYRREPSRCGKDSAGRAGGMRMCPWHLAMVARGKKVVPYWDKDGQ